MANIQIFGTKKCNQTRKAERFFKERGAKFQFVDLKKKGLSPGELQSVQRHIPLAQLMNKESKEYLRLNLKYMVHDPQQILLDHPLLLHTPIIRFGKEATIGFQPDIWKNWV